LAKLVSLNIKPLSHGNDLKSLSERTNNMKTSFLQNLGITDQSVIDSIMAENGKDINAVKSNTEKFETQINDLKTQLADRDTQLKDLKDAVKDNDKLTKKITELEDANNTAKTNYESKIADLEKDHATLEYLYSRNVKNVKAVMALLDKSKITHTNGKLDGLSNQVDELEKDETLTSLFGKTIQAPSGTNLNPNQGPISAPKASSFAEAVANAIKGK